VLELVLPALSDIVITAPNEPTNISPFRTVLVMELDKLIVLFLRPIVCPLSRSLEVSAHESVHGSSITVWNKSVDLIPKVAFRDDVRGDWKFAVCATLGMLNHLVKLGRRNAMHGAEIEFIRFYLLHFIRRIEANSQVVFLPGA
jgi:hypothetical protein